VYFCHYSTLSCSLLLVRSSSPSFANTFDYASFDRLRTLHRRTLSVVEVQCSSRVKSRDEPSCGSTNSPCLWFDWLTILRTILSAIEGESCRAKSRQAHAKDYSLLLKYLLAISTSFFILKSRHSLFLNLRSLRILFKKITSMSFP